ncbi:hypothetical protein L9F63_001358, partial [Diploptera punctata]
FSRYFRNNLMLRIVSLITPHSVPLKIGRKNYEALFVTTLPSVNNCTYSLNGDDGGLLPLQPFLQILTFFFHSRKSTFLLHFHI